jgi:hypothetical protein
MLGVNYGKIVVPIDANILEIEIVINNINYNMKQRTRGERKQVWKN